MNRRDFIATGGIAALLGVPDVLCANQPVKSVEHNNKIYLKIENKELTTRQNGSGKILPAGSENKYTVYSNDANRLINLSQEYVEKADYARGAFGIHIYLSEDTSLPRFFVRRYVYPEQNREGDKKFLMALFCRKPRLIEEYKP